MTINLEELERLAKAAHDAQAASQAKGIARPWRNDGGANGRYTISASGPIVAQTCGVWKDDELRAFADHIAAANPAAVLALLERLRAAEEIVRDMAACNGIIDSGYHRCAFQDTHRCRATTVDTMDHAESCAYRRAREATR